MKSKLFFLLTSIIWVAVADEKTITVKITAQQVLALRTISKDCAEKIGVDPGLLPKVIDWTFDVDEPTKAYVYCLSTNAGYVNEDGTINKPLMLHFDIVKGTREDYIEKMNECSKIRKDNKIDTVFEIGNCFNKIVEFIVIKPNV